MSHIAPIKKKYMGMTHIQFGVLKGGWGKGYERFGGSIYKQYKYTKREENIKKSCRRTSVNPKRPQCMIRCRNSYERKLMHQTATQYNLIHYTVTLRDIEYTTYISEGLPSHGLYDYTQTSIPRYIKAVVLINPAPIIKMISEWCNKTRPINIIMTYLMAQEEHEYKYKYKYPIKN